jgi:hypothetical protein
LEALAVKIKVPSNRLPNSQAYLSLIKLTQERLISITIKQLMDSGIVNTAYGRGLDFKDAVSTEDSVSHLANLISRYLEQKYPHILLAKGGTTKLIRGGATGVGIGIQFIFKDQDAVFKGSIRSDRDIEENQATQSEVSAFGVPKWLNRYVARLNKLCIEKKIPGYISLAVAQYAMVPSLLKSDVVDKAYIRVTINFDPGLITDASDFPNQRWQTSYGTFGRTRHIYGSAMGALSTVRSVQEDMGEAKTTGIKIHSMPLYSLAFFVTDMTQIIKTLHRKAEYVSSVFAVKL